MTADGEPRPRDLVIVKLGTFLMVLGGLLAIFDVLVVPFAGFEGTRVGALTATWPEPFAMGYGLCLLAAVLHAQDAGEWSR